MINEIIGSILEAEKEADDIINNANANALKMYTSAKQRASEINKEAKDEMYSVAQNKYINAETEGEKEAADIISKGKQKAEALENIDKEKYDKAVEYILRRLYET